MQDCGCGHKDIVTFLQVQRETLVPIPSFLTNLEDEIYNIMRDLPVDLVRSPRELRKTFFSELLIPSVPSIEGFSGDAKVPRGS